MATTRPNLDHDAIAEAVAMRLQVQLERMEAQMQAMAAQMSMVGQQRQQLEKGEGEQVAGAATQAREGMLAVPTQQSDNSVSPSFSLEVETKAKQKSALLLDPFEPFEVETKTKQKSAPLLDPFEPFEVQGTSTLSRSVWRRADTQETWSGGKSCLTTVVTSRNFDWICMGVITLNTIFAVYATNYFASRETHTAPISFWIFESFFATWYTIEVFSKLLVHRCAFFYGQDRGWNTFDLLLVLFMLIDLLLRRITQAIDVSFLRGFRILKAARILRLFKALHFLQELSLMIACVMNSVWTLVWTCVFLGFSLLIAGLLFVQLMTNFRIDGDTSPETDAKIELWFGSVARAMLVILQGATGGIAWGQVYDVVSASGTTNATLFLMVIIFFRFAFLSIVTSLFVDKAKKLGQPDEEDMVIKRREDELVVQKKLHNLFQKLDKDGDGFLSMQELKVLEEDPISRFFFELHGIGIKDPRMFFRKIFADHGEPHGVKVESLVDACMEVKGWASTLDMQVVMSRMTALSQGLNSLPEQLHPRMTALSQGMMGLSKQLNALPPKAVGQPVASH